MLLSGPCRVFILTTVGGKAVRPLELAVWDPLSTAPLPFTLAWYTGEAAVCWLGFVTETAGLRLIAWRDSVWMRGGHSTCSSPVSVRGSFVLRWGLGHSTKLSASSARELSRPHVPPFWVVRVEKRQSFHSKWRCRDTARLTKSLS